MALPQYSDKPQSFREALSTGLRQGISDVLQSKLEGLAQRNATNDISSRIQELGIPREYANYFSTLPHEYQVPLIQSYFQSQNKPVQAAPSSGEYIPGPAQQLEQQLQQPIAPQLSASQPQIIQSQNIPGKVFGGALDKEARKQQEQIRREQAKQQESMRKEEVKRLATAEQETLPFYHNVLKDEQASRNSDVRLDKMINLINKGSLPSSAFYNLFKGMAESDTGKHIPLIGPLVSLLVNPLVRTAGGALGAVQRGVTARDTEEFEKLSADFVKNAKDYFPGRVTNTELEAFLKTIPTLSNTDNGKKSIIRNMKIMNKAANIRAKSMKDIIKENRGRRPENLEILVEERSRPELDRIGDEFKNSIDNDKQINALKRLLLPLPSALDLV